MTRSLMCMHKFTQDTGLSRWERLEALIPELQRVSVMPESSKPS